MKVGEYRIVEQELDVKRVVWWVTVQRFGKTWPTITKKVLLRADLEGKRKYGKWVEKYAEKQRNAAKVKARLEGKQRFSAEDTLKTWRDEWYKIT